MLLSWQKRRVLHVGTHKRPFALARENYTVRAIVHIIMGCLSKIIHTSTSIWELEAMGYDFSSIVCPSHRNGNTKNTHAIASDHINPKINDRNNRFYASSKTSSKSFLKKFILVNMKRGKETPNRNKTEHTKHFIK